MLNLKKRKNMEENVTSKLTPLQQHRNPHRQHLHFKSSIKHA